jgi:protein subunit release factor A
LRQRKSELLALSAAPGFWDEQSASRKLLDEIYRLDSILGAFDNLESRLRAEAENAQRHRTSDRDLQAVDDRLDALEHEVRHVAFLVECSEPRQLCDALLTLRLVASHGGMLDSVLLLAKMYQGLAGRRGLEVDILDDRRGGDPHEDTLTLAVAGPGAYALLAGETGLHQVSRGRKQLQGGKRRAAVREVVHVEVLPAPLGDAPLATEEVRVEVQNLGNNRGRLLHSVKHDVRLFHAPSLTSVRGWMDGTRTEAIARLRPLLLARLEAARQRADQTTSRPPVVRRYTLGPTTLVRDLRSGRTTGRLDQVLEGQLDAFL